MLFISISCSSSSYSERYKKPSTEQTETKKESIRFSNVDDPTPDISDSQSPDSMKLSNNISTYSNGQEEFDETPVEEYPVDVTSIMEKHSHLKNFGNVLTNREKLLFEVLSYMDTPYQYGGNSKTGIDCSAFTKNVFNTVIGSELPRSARDQYSVGDKIEGKDSLKFGDLVFFNTTKRAYPGHVGIYLGDNLFAHSSRSKGVTITSMDNEYYKKRFISGRRIESFN